MIGRRQLFSIGAAGLLPVAGQTTPPASELEGLIFFDAARVDATALQCTPGYTWIPFIARSHDPLVFAVKDSDREFVEKLISELVQEKRL